MKNIHVLATDKPSRLVLDDTTQNLILINKGEALWGNQHIYITDDSEIKDVRLHKGKWQLEKGQILNKFPTYLTDLSECKLVVMTTDPDLIADGVQAIDDELLKWFVKNPNCEQVEVITEDVEQPRPLYPNGNHKGERIWMKQYKIILPQEEPKCFYDKPSSCENSECRVLNKCNGEFISSKQETGKEFYESADKVITVNREEEPKQYPIAGYAPGNYMCYCSTCDIKFQGDKRAVQCEPCAIKTVDEAKQRAKNSMALKGALDVKEETLEEAAEKYHKKISKKRNTQLGIPSQDFEAGAKYQAKRMYSEEEVLELLHKRMIHTLGDDYQETTTTKWFEQFKKK